MIHIKFQVNLFLKIRVKKNYEVGWSPCLLTYKACFVFPNLMLSLICMTIHREITIPIPVKWWIICFYKAYISIIFIFGNPADIHSNWASFITHQKWHSPLRMCNKPMFEKMTILRRLCFLPSFNNPTQHLCPRSLFSVRTTQTKWPKTLE